MLINSFYSCLKKSITHLPKYYFPIRKQALEAFLQGSNENKGQETKIIDINNGCVYFKDPTNKFSYMKQFMIDQNNKGVIVDIRQQYTGGVLYNSQTNIQEIAPTNHSATTFSQPLYFRNIYDINQKPLTEANQEQQIQYQNFKSGKLRADSSKLDKMAIFDPLIDLCYPINSGDFKILEGSRGTGKSQFLFNVMKDLLKMNYKVLYFNLNKNDCLKLNKLQGDWIAFTESQESSGSLFLALKMVKLAQYLVSEGNQVVVVIENIAQLLQRQESIFSNFGQPIAPFSVINSLYDLSGKTSQYQSTLTTFITIQQNPNEQAASAYSNSLKHVRSLSNPIKFPLEVKRSQGISPISQYINKLSLQKNQIDQKKLFKIPVDSYDYYFFYDSSWWVKSLTKFKANNKYTLALFYKFLQWNIQKDYCSQWQIPAQKSFQNFLQYIDPSIQMFLINDKQRTQQLFQQFLLQSRIKGDFSPFKKDYL